MRRINYDSVEIKAIARFSMQGLSTRSIAHKLGLTENQVMYRMQQTGMVKERQLFRSGKGRMFNAVQKFKDVRDISNTALYEKLEKRGLLIRNYEERKNSVAYASANKKNARIGDFKLYYKE